MRTASLVICTVIATWITHLPEAAGDGGALRPEPVEGRCPEPVEGRCPEPVEGARASISAGAGPVWPAGDLARYAAPSVGWSARVDLSGPAGFGAAAEVEQTVLSRAPVMPDQIDLQLQGLFAGLTWSRPLGAGFALDTALMAGRWTLRMSAPRAPRHHTGAAHRLTAGLSWSPTSRLRVGARWSATSALLELSHRRHLRARATGLRIYLGLDI